MLKVLSSLALLILLVGTPFHSRAAEPASDIAYYQQFMFSSETDADGVTTNRALLSPRFAIASTPKGPIEAQFEIFLFPNASAVVKYTEYHFEAAPFIRNTKFSVSWSVPADSFLLGDFGAGSRTVSPMGSAVALQLTKDLVTPGLAGQSVVLDYGYTSDSPAD